MASLTFLLVVGLYSRFLLDIFFIWFSQSYNTWDLWVILTRNDHLAERTRISFDSDAAGVTARCTYCPTPTIKGYVSIVSQSLKVATRCKQTEVADLQTSWLLVAYGQRIQKESSMLESSSEGPLSLCTEGLESIDTVWGYRRLQATHQTKQTRNDCVVHDLLQFTSVVQRISTSRRWNPVTCRYSLTCLQQ